MNEVRLGVVGMGGMGSHHARKVAEGKVPRARLAAVCDADAKRLEPWKDAAKFARSAELIRSGTVDAVVIATPHYAHTTVGVDALRQGLHVLVEKPISSHVADAERLIAARARPDQVFAAMFNMRTDDYYIKLRNLIRRGELGSVLRYQWTVTNWYRTQNYYNSGGWRGTWEGEGGGVLLNQAPHNLDLLWWMFGRPSKLRAFCHFGKYHRIEVEDEVTAYLEYESGATGVFIASTGEAPGTNRLEIAADRGRVVFENDQIVFNRTVEPVPVHRAGSDKLYAVPETWNAVVPAAGHGGQHVEVLKNFADAILDGAPLIAPAEDGLYSVELANAMIYSSVKNETVTLPLDGQAYEGVLQQLIAGARADRT